MNDLISKEKVLELLYEVKNNDDIPKNYRTILDIIRQVRELPTFQFMDIYEIENDIEPVSKEFLKDCKRTAEKYKKRRNNNE